MAKPVPNQHRGPRDIKRVHPNELAGWPARVMNVFSRFNADKGPIMAAALSFFVLLSIVPVLLVTIWLLSVALQGDSHQAVADIQKVVTRVLPGASVQRAYTQIAQQVNLAGYIQGIFDRGAMAGVIGLLGLFWAAMQVFVNAAGTLNAAFEVNESRSWVRLRLVAFGVLIAAAVLMILSVFATSGPDAARNLLPRLGIPNPAPWPLDVFFLALALGLNVCTFAVIYRFLPAARVAWRDAFIGGAFMAVGWVVATKLFALYLAKDNKMYGAFAGVILLITWVYYTNMLMLLGAEVTAVAGKLRRGAAVPDEESLRHMELEAVQAGRAQPIPRPVDPSDRAREDLAAIRDHVKAMGAAVRSAAHNIRHTSERNRTGRAGV